MDLIGQGVLEIDGNQKLTDAQTDARMPAGQQYPLAQFGLSGKKQWKIQRNKTQYEKI